jgi:hypothetical protein
VIVRIMGEGRYDVPDADMPAVEQADGALVEALDGGDGAAFATALADLISVVRHTGKLLPADDVGPSEQAVPHEGSTLAEVKALLTEGG